MTRPDAAAAIMWAERARSAQIEANDWHARADAVHQRPDRDDLDGDCRREVARLLRAVAARVEQKADDCRERAADAQHIRSVSPDPVGGPYADPFAAKYDDEHAAEGHVCIWCQPGSDTRRPA